MMYVFISAYVLRCELTILGLVSYRRGITDPCRLCLKDVPYNVQHQLLYEPLGGQKQCVSWGVLLAATALSRANIYGHILLYRSPTAIRNVSGEKGYKMRKKNEIMTGGIANRRPLHRIRTDVTELERWQYCKRALHD